MSLPSLQISPIKIITNLEVPNFYRFQHFEIKLSNFMRVYYTTQTWF